MPDLVPIQNALRIIGQRPEDVLGPHTAHVLADGSNLLSTQSLPGISLVAQAKEGRIAVELRIAEEHQADSPIHLCFGLFKPDGIQTVSLDLKLCPNAKANIWSHCLFSQANQATHQMNARIQIEAGANLNYQEVHYHGASGGIKVLPQATVIVGAKARFRSDFTLIQGKVGLLAIDYDVDVQEDGLAELTSKVYGSGQDVIRIQERIRLNGRNARGLIKTRLAVRDHASAEVRGATYGNAAGARGHVDCTEIVRDSAVVSAIPEVKVTNPQAKVTHEAAIGSVDAKQLETLMARGLSPDSAVDFIIRGMLA